MEFERRPYNRPVSLVARGDGIVLRIVSERGERMATHLRPLQLRDLRYVLRRRQQR